MINPHWRDVTAAGAGPGMPRVTELARTEAGRAYHNRTGGRAAGIVAVQVTLSGLGAVWTAPEAPPRLVPRGAALIFRTATDRIAYGLPPGGGRWEFVYANLAGTAAEAMAGDLIAAHGHVLAIDPAHPVVAELMVLDRGRDRGDLVLPLARAARLACDLLLALAEAAPGGGSRDADLAGRIAAGLERHLAEPGAVGACASGLGISREHLARAFARATGEPPSAWLRRRRIAAAAALLLAEPDLPVAGVAARCGFATASHFVHAFRRARGTTPAAFRADSRDGLPSR